MASMIIGGYDPINGPKLYSLPIGGGIIECNYSLGGSGSGFIYGFVDANFKLNFSLEEAKKFMLTGEIIFKKLIKNSNFFGNEKRRELWWMC